jgi:Ca2+-binding RTX toxin-like protein
MCLLAVVFITVLSTLFVEAMGLSLSSSSIGDSQSSISLPGSGLLSNIGSGLLSNNFQGLIRNASNIISDIGSHGCLLNAIKGGSIHVEREDSLITGTDCDDFIEGDRKDNVIFAQSGDDKVYSTDGNDIIFSGTGNDRLYGGDDDDLLVAGIGSNVVDGGKGDDVLLAGAGEGLLIGGDGNDKLFAGPANTIMYGGKGANHFDCSLPVAGLARSIVMDYNPVNGDTISGECKIVNTIGSGVSNGLGSMSQITLPDTQDANVQQ